MANAMTHVTLGGACDQRCAVCDCHDGASPADAQGVPFAVRGGGGRLVLRGNAPSSPYFARVLETAAGARWDEVWLRTPGDRYVSLDAAVDLHARGVRGVIVPLFSSVSAVHDRVAGRPGALVDALRAMRSLSAAGVSVSVEAPLLPVKLQDLTAVLELAHRAVPSLAGARFYAPDAGGAGGDRAAAVGRRARVAARGDRVVRGAQGARGAARVRWRAAVRARPRRGPAAGLPHQPHAQGVAPVGERARGGVRGLRGARPLPRGDRRLPRGARGERPRALRGEAPTSLRAAHHAAPRVDRRAASLGVAGAQPGAAPHGALQPGLPLLQRQRDHGERVQAPRGDVPPHRPHGALGGAAHLVLGRRAGALEGPRALRPHRVAPRGEGRGAGDQRRAARHAREGAAVDRGGAHQGLRLAARATTRPSRGGRRRRSATSTRPCAASTRCSRGA
jgi:hypothetical protein